MTFEEASEKAMQCVHALQFPELVKRKYKWMQYLRGVITDMVIEQEW